MNGKVHIIEDTAGHQIFPSIVSYFENGGRHMMHYDRVHNHNRCCGWIRCFKAFNFPSRNDNIQCQAIHRSQVMSSILPTSSFQLVGKTQVCKNTF